MKLRSVGLMAVLALVVVSCGGASPEAGGPSEGIQVHGDWTIDVYNQDGTLDEHVEFENALVQGDHVLAELLTGQAASSGIWRIEFGENSGSTVCPSESNGQCTIGGVVAQEGFGAVVTLEGSMTVEADGNVDSVSTRMGRCAPTSAPADCQVDSSNFIFSQKFLDPSDQVSVVGGQSVSVQVEFSFTSG